MENLKKKEADDLSLFDGSTQYTSTLKVLSYYDMGPFLIEDVILVEKMAASNFENFVYIYNHAKYNYPLMSNKCLYRVPYTTTNTYHSKTYHVTLAP